MQKRRKKDRKSELKEEESQKELINNTSVSDMIEVTRRLYGAGVLGFSVALPTTLITKLGQVFPVCMEVNRSATIAYLVHQGLVRVLELSEK